MTEADLITKMLHENALRYRRSHPDRKEYTWKAPSTASTMPSPTPSAPGNASLEEIDLARRVMENQRIRHAEGSRNKNRSSK